jgi:hypothetical protein
VLAFQTANAVEKYLKSAIEHGSAAMEEINLRGKRID